MNESSVDIENEEWKNLEYLSPNLQVSNQGRVRRWKTMKEFVIVQGSMSGGYLFICNECTQYAIHRLVADAFLPTPSNLTHFVVNHKNGNKLDNRAANLEKVPKKVDVTKSYKRGTATRKKIYCPELDTVYATVRSAAVVTKIPQEMVSKSLYDNERICGLSFQWIEHSDPIVSTHDLIYIGLDELIQAGLASNSVEEFHLQLNNYIDYICPL